MYNKRQLFIGTLIGILVPAFIMSLIYAIKFGESSVSSFIENAIQQGVAAPIVALSIVGNLGLFFLFLHFEKLWASRGVMIATFLYGLLMLYLKLLS